MLPPPNFPRTQVSWWTACRRRGHLRGAGLRDDPGRNLRGALFDPTRLKLKILQSPDIPASHVCRSVCLAVCLVSMYASMST